MNRKPRTESGKKLIYELSRLVENPGDPPRATAVVAKMLAEEYVARAEAEALPGSREALTELRDMHERLHDLTWEGCEVCGVIRAALRNPDD